MTIESSPGSEYPSYLAIERERFNGEVIAMVGGTLACEIE